MADMVLTRFDPTALPSLAIMEMAGPTDRTVVF